jgi:hypothetical protein
LNIPQRRFGDAGIDMGRDQEKPVDANARAFLGDAAGTSAGAGCKAALVCKETFL